MTWRNYGVFRRGRGNRGNSFRVEFNLVVKPGRDVFGCGVAEGYAEMLEEIMTVADIVSYIDLTAQRVRELLRQDKIRGRRLGVGCWVTTQKELLLFMANRGRKPHFPQRQRRRRKAMPN